LTDTGCAALESASAIGYHPLSVIDIERAMAQPKEIKISIRLSREVHDALAAQAAKKGFEPGDHIRRTLEKRAAKSGLMPAPEAERIRLHWEVVERFQALARAIDAEGGFDAHFTLNVFRRAMADPALRTLYERAIGGDAFAAGVAGKSPLNMYLGFYVRHAVGAHPKIDAFGKPQRGQVRGEPVQSYQLLSKLDAERQRAISAGP